jgi:DMSO reductase anchor subunit
MVTPIYLILALATGAVWADSLLTIFEARPSWLPMVTAACLVFAAIMKLIYWRNIDTEKRTYTIESATGLGRIGKVRPLEPAHTQPNFVMREMGYKVGRSHAEKLRKLALVLTFIVPAILVLLPLTSYPLQVVVALLAIGSTMMGVFVERWLFFAEAEHVVMLYYGEDRA